jgi:hypothetical protein
MDTVNETFMCTRDYDGKITYMCNLRERFRGFFQRMRTKPKFFSHVSKTSIRDCLTFPLSCNQQSHLLNT